MDYEIRQGYVRQGLEEGRVVTVADVAHKLNQYINLFGPVLFGTITLDPDAIYQYGTIDRVELNDTKAQWTFVFRHAETHDEMKVTFPFSAISLTHDVEYTVDDEHRGNVTYPVFYITVTDEEQSVTYYVGSKRLVSKPLDCIAEFYLRSYRIGQDMTLPERRACSFRPPSPSA